MLKKSKRRRFSRRWYIIGQLYDVFPDGSDDVLNDEWICSKHWFRWVAAVKMNNEHPENPFVVPSKTKAYLWHVDKL